MKLIDIAPNTYFFFTGDNMLFLKTDKTVKNKSVCVSMQSDNYGVGYKKSFSNKTEITTINKPKDFKKVKQVVRIENLGRGFFRPSDNRITITNRYKNILGKHSNFPIPQDDRDINLRLGNKYYFCGYKSIDQIYEWLSSDDIKWLIKKDFKIILYDVVEYQEGDFQIAFTKEGIVSSKDVTSLFI